MIFVANNSKPTTDTNSYNKSSSKSVDRPKQNHGSSCHNSTNKGARYVTFSDIIKSCISAATLIILKFNSKNLMSRTVEIPDTTKKWIKVLRQKKTKGGKIEITIAEVQLFGELKYHIDELRENLSSLKMAQTDAEKYCIGLESDKNKLNEEIKAAKKSGNKNLKQLNAELAEIKDKLRMVKKHLGNINNRIGQNELEINEYLRLGKKHLSINLASAL